MGTYLFSLDIMVMKEMLKEEYQRFCQSQASVEIKELLEGYHN